MFVWINVQVDTTKHVQPIAVKPLPATTAIQETVENLSEVGSNYKTMTKYTFYESGEKYVKVLLDFKGAKTLLTNESIKCNFGDRSFEIYI